LCDVKDPTLSRQPEDNHDEPMSECQVNLKRIERNYPIKVLCSVHETGH
jgi:hypothetical protein